MKRIDNRRRRIPSARRALHCLAAAVLHYSGLLSLACWIRRITLKRPAIVVLGLHRVLTPSQEARSLSEPGMIMLLSSFESVLRTLRKSYRVVGLAEFAAFAGEKTSRPLCLITFDDGWRDTFANAYPALRRLKLPAALFVATNLIGQQSLFWVERLTRLWSQQSNPTEVLLSRLRELLPAMEISSLDDAIAALKELPASQRDDCISLAESICPRLPVPDPVDAFMDWDQVCASTDVFEIASHTVTHPLLTHEQPEFVELELIESKRELESRFMRQIAAIAYPSGDYDADVQRAAAQAGYALAFTTDRGVYRWGDERLAVPRILLHEGNVTGLTGRFSPAMFHLRLTGWR